MSADLFEKAAQACTDYGKAGGKMSNDQALGLYGLFKQSNVGDVNTDRPGIFS
jgi:diazepam-binding inhibitor (GABA receptor modulating acyl-CoA-binding protein)